MEKKEILLFKVIQLEWIGNSDLAETVKLVPQKCTNKKCYSLKKTKRIQKMKLTKLLGSYFKNDLVSSKTAGVPKKSLEKQVFVWLKNWKVAECSNLELRFVN